GRDNQPTVRIGRASRFHQVRVWSLLGVAVDTFSAWPDGAQTEYDRRHDYEDLPCRAGEHEGARIAAIGVHFLAPGTHREVTFGNGVVEHGGEGEERRAGPGVGRHRLAPQVEEKSPALAVWGAPA